MRTGETFQLSLWAHEETSLRAERGQVSLVDLQDLLSSLALPKLALQCEPVRELVARFGGARAPGAGASDGLSRGHSAAAEVSTRSLGSS